MSADIRTAGYIFLLLLASFFILTNGFPCGDSSVSIATCKAIFDTRSLAIPEPIDFANPETDARLVKGRDGKYYSMFGLGWIVALIPFYGAGLAISKIFSFVDPNRILLLTLAMLQAVAVAETAALLFIFSRRLGFGGKVSILLAASYAFTTTAFVYSKGQGIDYLNGLFILAAFYTLYKYGLSGRRGTLLAAGFFAGFALTIKIFDLIILPAFIIYIVWLKKGSRRIFEPVIAKDILIFMAWPVFFMLVISWYNAYRFGAFYLSGYHTEIIKKYTLGPYPVYKGLYGLLLSPGKGAFLYNPPLILALAGISAFVKKFRREAAFIFIATIPSLLFISGMRGWDGGYSWGARYLAPFLPLWLLFLVPVIEDSMRLRKIAIILAAVLMAGFLVQLPAVVMNYNFAYDLVRVNFYRETPLSFWEDIALRPGLSPLVNTYKIFVAYLHNLFNEGMQYISINNTSLPLSISHITPSPWIFQVYKLGYGNSVKAAAIGLYTLALVIAAFLVIRLYYYWKDHPVGQ